MPTEPPPAVIEIADVLQHGWRATDLADGSAAVIVPVVLADGSSAALAMTRIVAARRWGALDGRDPGRLDPPPTVPPTFGS
jgi:hypothetical protein